MDGWFVGWLDAHTQKKIMCTRLSSPSKYLQNICTYLYGTQGPRLAVLGLPSQVLAVAWADQYPSEACLHNERWNICATLRIHNLCRLLTNDLCLIPSIMILQGAILDPGCLEDLRNWPSVSW